MVADIGAKALTSARFEELKKQLNIVSRNAKEKENEKKEEKKPEEEEKEGMRKGVEDDGTKLQKAAMVLKLITIAATISAAKGQGDGDNSSDEGMSFGWIVTFYTTLVMIGALVGWYLLKEGVSLVSDRSTPWTPVRRARKSANKMKEESEKEEEEEEEMPRPTSLPTPTQSPGPRTPRPLRLQCLSCRITLQLSLQ